MEDKEVKAVNITFEIYGRSSESVQIERQDYIEESFVGPYMGGIDN